MIPGVSRRSVLQTVATGAVLAATGGALSACSTSGGTRSDVGNAGSKLAPWPTYIPFAGPAPDLAPTAAGVQAGYLTYPKSLKQAVPEKPGDGKKITAWVVTYGAPPKELARNAFHQAINEALGVDLELTVVPSSEFGTKVATMMASGDMPDLINITGSLPNESQYVVAKCQDLTGFLSGDAVKDYPNLANIPAYAWEGMGRIKGRIYGVPVERPLVGAGLISNVEKLKQAGIWVPQAGALDVASFTKGLAQLSGKGKYGLGASMSGTLGAQVHLAMHGAPNEWAVKDGKFTTTYGTEEFKSGVEQMAAWFKAGVYSPDAAALDPNTVKLDFYNGTVATTYDAYGGYKAAIPAVNNAFTVDFARPYKPAGGAAPKHWFGGGFFGYTVLKKAPKERIELLLRVLNFLASPFGTKEWELINYGVEGTHFTRGGDGGPVQTKLALEGENTTTLPVIYLAAGPQTLYFPGNPEAARRYHAFQQEIVPTGLANPKYGLRSNTSSAKGAALDKQRADAFMAVVTGKKPLSEWDSVVKEWKSKGGDRIAEELAEEYAASGR